MPPVPFLGQLPTNVCCHLSVPDAPAGESAKAPEMKARRPRSSLPPVLGTESEYCSALPGVPRPEGQPRPCLPPTAQGLLETEPGASSQASHLSRPPIACVEAPVHPPPHSGPSSFSQGSWESFSSPLPGGSFLLAGRPFKTVALALPLLVGVPSSPQASESPTGEPPPLAARHTCHTCTRTFWRWPQPAFQALPPAP